jgi:diguanylate cyclase (GGDEF)-like protein
MRNTKQYILSVYEWFVISGALICVLVGLQHHYVPIDSVTFFSLLTLAIGTELFLIPLSTDVYTTLTSSAIVGIILILGPDIAAVIMAIASLLVPILQRENYRRIYVFNSANYVFCIYISTYVTSALLKTPFPIHPDVFSFNFLSIFCLMLIFHIVNHVLLDVLFVLRDGNKNIHRFWNVFLIDGIYHFLGAPLAILILELHAYAKYMVLAMFPLAMMGQVLRLNRNLTATHKMQQFAIQLNKEFDFDSIARQALKFITQKSEAANAAFLFMDATGTKLITRFVEDPSKNDFKDLYDFNNEEDRGIIYSVINTRKAENIKQASKDKRAKYRGDKPCYESMMVIPLTARNEVIGICVCYGRRTFAFSNETFQLISAFAVQVGVILENARLYTDLQETVSRDGTTGLYNYRHFYQELSHRFARAQEHQMPFSVAVIDIDYFKQFNDMYGHLVGDEVIRQVGYILAKGIGKHGLVARYGGEEFAVLLNLNAKESYELLERIRKDIANLHFEYQGFRVCGITISSGIAAYPLHGQEETLLLEKADQALYWGAKQRGRNKTAIYSDELDKQLYVDSETKLYTIHYLSMYLTEDMHRKFDPTSYAIICLKLLGLDQLSHAFGIEKKEQLIQQVASIIRSSVRQDEIACRFGDGEFILFVPGIERIESEKIMERILKKVNEHTFSLREKVFSKVKMVGDCILHSDGNGSTKEIFEIIPHVFESLATQTELQYGHGHFI